MKNKDYWEAREKERLDILDISIDEQIATIKRVMDETINKIENDIYKLYEKYGTDNEMSYQEALFYLSDDERKEFQKDLKYYIETFKDNTKAKIYKDELQALSTRARVKRLQVLQTNIRIQATELEKLLQDKLPSVFDAIYQDSYFYNLYSQNLYTNNLGIRFDIPSPNVVKELLTRPWSGKNYSEKVWNTTNNFTYKLDSVVTGGLIRGEHPNIIAKNLRDAIVGKNGKGGKLYEYKRLVRTEAAFIAEQATKNSYKDNNIKKYEYLATLDLRTSIICQELDGKEFELDKAVTGVNYPPMHAHCRSTTIPVIKWNDENDELEQRISRDPMTGRNSYIDYIDYSDWKDEQYSKYGKDKITAEEKKIRNRASDKKQYAQYKKELGDLAPETFEEYQEIKYNNKEEWDTLKDNFKVINMYKVDFGNVSPAKIIELDKLAFDSKQTRFDYTLFTGKNKKKVKSLISGGNFAIMEFNGRQYFAHSSVNEADEIEYKSITGDKSDFILHKDNRTFETLVINNIPRHFCTEAKMFEFVNDNINNKYKGELTILSELDMCQSCRGVLKQFNELYPNLKVNIVSGKEGVNWRKRK